MSSTTSSASSISSVLADVEPARTTRRGRGRGRGRGKQTAGQRQARRSARNPRPGTSTGSQTRRDLISLHTIQTRKDRFKAQLAGMPKEEMEDLIIKVLEAHPSMILDLHAPAQRFPGGYHPPEAGDSPDWCVCGHCRPMPSVVERVCCDQSPEHCFSFLPDFSVLILDEAVLSLARMYWRDIMVLNDEVDHMKANRHAAYRQYILWTYGRLTTGDRRVIPSCCVWRIRDKFPDQYSQYTGFMPGRLV